MTLYSMVFMGFITGHTISTLGNGITFQSVEDALNFSLFIQVSDRAASLIVVHSLYARVLSVVNEIESSCVRQ